MVNVDDLAFEFLAELLAQNLHVASKHNQFNASGLDVIPQHVFKGQLVGFAGDWVHLKWNAIKLGQALKVWVVSEYHRKFNRQLAGALAEQHVVQAVGAL